MTTIPQSTALAECDTDSLSELFSRDPEGYQQQDRDRIISALRAQRAKWEAVEASGGNKRERSKVGGLGAASSASAEDLGL